MNKYFKAALAATFFSFFAVSATAQSFNPSEDCWEANDPMAREIFQGRVKEFFGGVLPLPADVVENSLNETGGVLMIYVPNEKVMVTLVRGKRDFLGEGPIMDCIVFDRDV